MENSLISKMEQGCKVLGAFSTLSIASAVECLGLAGLDFVIVDTEHGVGDVEATLTSVVAAERRDMTPLIRIKDPTRSSVLKMLDIGAMGLIIPYIQTIDEVEKLVEYAKYAPLGSRGFGVVRASAFGTQPLSTEEYFEESNRKTLLIPQCETAGCLNDIEAIAGIEGVDGIFVGPYDLSVALGVPGKMRDDKLMSAISRVLAACRAAKKYSFIFAGDAKIARDYFDMGFDAVACGVDTMFLIGAAREMKETVIA